MAKDDFFQGAIDDFVSLILQHEGLVPGQTPFRITSKKMKGWNTVHGYQVMKKGIPADRSNFIFLKNPMEVPPAVRKQFSNYSQYPERFGLPINPTVGQAVNVFDQTGAPGKLSFLRSRGVNPDLPLASLFKEN